MAKIRNSKVAPVGKQFGRLTVCGPSYTGVNNSTLVPGRCTCGDIREYFVSNLTRQTEPMCPGCRLASRPSKGHHKHPLFVIWKAMIQRCENPKHTYFKSYGGRGIAICSRWRNDFTAFAADMGDRPSPEHTIDREDPNGHYEPDNCRWAVRKVQGNNRRNEFHRYIDWRGEKLTLAEAADHAGISKELLHWRLGRDWSIEKAMTAPVRRKAA